MLNSIIPACFDENPMIEGFNQTERVGTVLIAEDEDDIRELLAYRLRKEGYQTVLAANGRTAYEMAAEYTPDLIILDIMMPEMDGWEVCRRIRGHHDPLVSTVPVIMLTALGDPRDKLMGLRLGADAFVSKTCPIKEVLLYCRNFLKLRSKYLALLHNKNFRANIPFNDIHRLLIHELKNHLSIIGGMSNLLAKANELAGKERNFINHIANSSEYLGMIANDLKLLEEIKDDGRHVPVNRFELNELIENVVGLQRSFAENRTINVRRRFFADPCPVQLNKTVVKIVVSMLLENALKYCHPGAEVHICSLREDNMIKIKIADNGPGIDASEQERIFEKEYRAKSVRQKISGTGLGLYLAKTLTKMLDGKITVESNPGHGSTFTATFREQSAANCRS